MVVALVPFVKTYYREMLREHVRLKQQLVLKFKKLRRRRRRRGEGAVGAAAPAVSASAATQGGQPTTKIERRASSSSSSSSSSYESMTESNALFRYLLLKSVGRFCQFWSANLMSSCEVRGKEIIHDAILKRKRNQALITVSNHVASIDDPFVTSLLVPDEAIEKTALSSSSKLDLETEFGLESEESKDAVHKNKVRWVMCATDRCFNSKLASTFFKAVQVLPVERGAGLHQPSMKVASSLLNKGGWVHIFPEGTRSRTGDLLKMKPGVGQLVVNTVNHLKRELLANAASSSSSSSSSSRSSELNSAIGDLSPLIVPYYHDGMGELMEKGRKFPKVGTRMKVVVGEPIEIRDLVVLFASGEMGEKELRSSILARVETAIHQLKETATQEDYVLTYNNSSIYEGNESSYKHSREILDPLQSLALECSNIWRRLLPLGLRAAMHQQEQQEEDRAKQEEQQEIRSLWDFKKSVYPLNLNMASLQM